MLAKWIAHATVHLDLILTLVVSHVGCAPRGPVGESVEGAEGESDVPLARRDGVAHVDGADGLDEERDEQVGKAQVQQQEVERGAAEGLLQGRHKGRFSLRQRGEGDVLRFMTTYDPITHHMLMYVVI